MILLIPNILAMMAEGQEGNLEIVLDRDHKQVFPGEDAVFYWTAYNNDTFTTYELSVSSSPESEFSESSFTLGPGESRTITQTAFTSISDENNTKYHYRVEWSGNWQRVLTSGSIGSMDWIIFVTVINDTESAQSELDGNDGTNPTPALVSILLIIAILVTLILMRKYRKKSAI